MQHRTRALRARRAELRALIDENAHGLNVKKALVVSSCEPHSEPTLEPWEASLLVQNCANDVGFAMWLGSADDSLNIKALKTRRVTAIINMAVGDCQMELERQDAISRVAFCTDHLWKGVEFSEKWYRQQMYCPDFWYLGVDAADRGDYPIWRTFADVSTFLAQCREAARSVLVHCMMGRNRSAFACAAFLMQHGLAAGGPSLTSLEAVDWISRRRADVLLNDSFLMQLIQYSSDRLKNEDEALSADTASRPERDIRLSDVTTDLTADAPYEGCEVEATELSPKTSGRVTMGIVQERRCPRGSMEVSGHDAHFHVNGLACSTTTVAESTSMSPDGAGKHPFRPQSRFKAQQALTRNI